MQLKIPAQFKPFIRFCLVGVFAAGVHYGIYYLLLRLHVPINPAYITGYLISFVGNFFATSYFTFHTRPSWARLVGFAGSHGVNFVLHIVLLNFFLWLGLNELIAPIAVMAVAMMVQYGILNVVFKDYSKPCGGNILLSFDTEEFDLPREFGVELPLEEQMAVSRRGISKVLDILQAKQVKATFFCTTTFATHAPDMMARIIGEGHEVASHGCDHWRPQTSDPATSKQILREQFEVEVTGYRQPRMMEVNEKELQKAGYQYNSSLHPAFIPGRYMHLNMPRKPFMQNGLLQIPMSVTPWLRLPVFWLACHWYPWGLYRCLCMRCLRHDHHFVIYFHPWEFERIGDKKEWKISRLIRHRCGEGMQQRLAQLIDMFQQQESSFVSYNEFTNHYE